MGNPLVVTISLLHSGNLRHSSEHFILLHENIFQGYLESFFRFPLSDPYDLACRVLIVFLEGFGSNALTPCEGWCSVLFFVFVLSIGRVHFNPLGRIISLGA